MKYPEIYLLIIILLLLGCGRNKIETTLNENGDIIEKRFYNENDVLSKVIRYYDRDPSLEFKITYKKSEFDSIIYYYDNGNIFKKGKRDLNSQLLGKWDLFDRDGNKREIREFVVWNGKAQLNRTWFLNRSGDTLAWREEDEVFKQQEFIHDTLAVRYTTFNVFKFNKDTIKLNEPIRGVAYCYSPMLEEYNSEIRVIVDSENESFNSDYSNEDEISVQVFSNLEKDTSNQKWFRNIKKRNLKYTAIFGNWFESTGPKTIKGFIEEYAIGPFEDQDADSITSRTFFEKQIYVLDSID
ncbi:hypothetical protein [Flagellimonas aurea]|uniref:hypothetical protein n=1 Tax=Flagellimonas aurea TaxID=2915619 RepID=UPI0035CEF209